MAETILETDRLILREMTDRDFPALCRMLQDQSVMYAYEHAFQTRRLGNGFASNRRGIERMASACGQQWRTSGEMVGQCGLTWQGLGDGTRIPEVGYLLERTAWRKGYAVEAAQACRDHAFQP